MHYKSNQQFTQSILVVSMVSFLWVFYCKDKHTKKENITPVVKSNSLQYMASLTASHVVFIVIVNFHKVLLT